jgi:hypothetical protein
MSGRIARICETHITVYGTALSVQRLATGWTTEGSQFEPGGVMNFLHVVQAVSEVHPTSYPMDTGGSFLGGRGVKLTTHLQLVLRSRKCGSIHLLLIRLHGVVLN